MERQRPRLGLCMPFFRSVVLPRKSHSPSPLSRPRLLLCKLLRSITTPPSAVVEAAAHLGVRKRAQWQQGNSSAFQPSRGCLWRSVSQGGCCRIGSCCAVLSPERRLAPGNAMSIVVIEYEWWKMYDSTAVCNERGVMTASYPPFLCRWSRCVPLLF